LGDKHLSTSVKLKIAITKLDSLPTIPVIAQKLLALPLDTEDGESKLLKLIGHDPLISAKIIGLANTSLFGTPVKVSSISDAAMRLGLTRVKSVAIGIATMSTLAKKPEGRLKANDLWMHSMCIALAMRTIAKAMPAHVRPLDDHIFLAGLLHDIGYMALAFLDTKASDALHGEFQVDANRPVLETEQALLGMTHCDIGAQLGHHWDLPEEVIAVMRFHHTPDEEGAEEGQPLVSMVNIAEKILPEFGINEPVEKEISEQEWLDLGIPPAKADDIRSKIAEVTAQSKELAGVV
jgi:HD-like signal output (HDOD) protein